MEQKKHREHLTQGHLVVASKIFMSPDNLLRVRALLYGTCVLKRGSWGRGGIQMGLGLVSSVSSQHLREHPGTLVPDLPS